MAFTEPQDHAATKTVVDFRCKIEKKSKKEAISLLASLHGEAGGFLIALLDSMAYFYFSDLICHAFRF